MKHTLKELADSVQAGYQARGAVKEDPAGTHWLIQMRDLRDDGTIDATTLTRFAPDREVDAYAVHEDDLLLQVRGVDHRAGVARELPVNTLASSHFYIFRIDKHRVLPEYLAWYINQPPAQNHLLRTAQGTGNLTVLTRADFESLPIPVPPLEKQRQIVALDQLQRREHELSSELQVKRSQWLSALCLHVAQDDAINTRTSAQ